MFICTIFKAEVGDKTGVYTFITNNIHNIITMFSIFTTE